MTRQRRRRRLWAWGLLALAVTSIVASLLVWISHLLEYFRAGTIHHQTLGKVIGIDHPILQTALCASLPIIGLLALNAFFAVWSIGVMRGDKRARLRGMAMPPEHPGASADMADDYRTPGPPWSEAEQDAPDVIPLKAGSR